MARVEKKQSNEEKKLHVEVVKQIEEREEIIIARSGGGEELFV